MRLTTVLLLLLTGLGLLVPGLYLAWLGGSVYYILAGAAVLASGLLVLRRRAAGIWLYAAMLLGTLAWALWESGLDGWALMPRLIFLMALAAWLLFYTLTDRSRRAGARPLLACLTLCLLALSAAALKPAGDDVEAQHDLLPSAATDMPSDGAWTHYGSTLHGTRYSSLAQITPANAGRLEQAWIYHAGLRARGGNRGGGLQVTPLMVDGTLYGCTAYNAVFALDPVTGKEIWRHDTAIHFAVAGHAVCRGVAFFRAPAGTAECPARLLLGTADNRLIALDARTGTPCRSFGKDGEVDLSEGLGPYPVGYTNPTSPPTIVNGIAVIGAFIADAQTTKAPSGVIRGYDAVSGRFKWAFDPGRPEAHGPPPSGQAYVPATPNAWTVFSGDEALGLVYVPTGNGSPDYFGGYRSAETDRFSSAVVALEANTGKVRWIFQAVHHDLWDYDLGAQPVLIDFPTPNGPVPALIQPTKTGQVFVLDRRSGRPLTRVEERAVPLSRLPGEHSASTQPFSVGMPDFVGPPLREARMWGITPFDQLYCRVMFRRADYQGIYTPLRLGYSIRMPGELGGIDWGSVSVDESRGILIINSNLMADYDQLINRQEADSERLFARGDPRGANAPRPRNPGAAMAGTPYAVHWRAFLTDLGIPCQQPPYGFLTAVDLRTQQILWRHRLGNAENSGILGVPLHLKLPLGAPNIGGSAVTAGGVIFIAATQDQYFRAIDEATGRILWETRLASGAHATPMTYKGRDGNQYVLVAAGGNPSFGTLAGDALIAFRLACSKAKCS